MPLYEYECSTCGRRFETLVTGGREPSCPGCQGRTLTKLYSVFGVGSSTHASPGRAAVAAGPT